MLDIAAELKHALYNMGMKLCEEEIEEMMREADRDGDGQISFPGNCIDLQGHLSVFVLM